MTLNIQQLSNVFRRNLSYNEASVFVQGISEQTNLVLWIGMSQSHCVCYNSLELLKVLVIFISPAFSNINFDSFIDAASLCKDFSNS